MNESLELAKLSVTIKESSADLEADLIDLVLASMKVPGRFSINPDVQS